MVFLNIIKKILFLGRSFGLNVGYVGIVCVLRGYLECSRMVIIIIIVKS